MDFNALIPLDSNALSIAARKNDFKTVKRLLIKFNPGCVDGRGWTSLHEAAVNDCYESLVLILENVDCRPLAETHEGYTALYLACSNYASLNTIKALLESTEDIANYGCTEYVTPLHVSSIRGNVEVMQLLIEYGAMVDVQDFNGNTPLHDAALACNYKAVAALLHAGADPEIINEFKYTPFHMVCFKGCYRTFEILFPFVHDINQRTVEGDTPLIQAVKGNNRKIIKFLIVNGADPHIENNDGETALSIALRMGCCPMMKFLFKHTDIKRMNKNLVLFACQPPYSETKLETLETLLYYDLGSEFYDFYEDFFITFEKNEGLLPKYRKIGGLLPKYTINSSLNAYLNMCEYIYNEFPEKCIEFFYLFLMKGLCVNALNKLECPPLVYLHYCVHDMTCFSKIFEILIEHDCNVDYRTLKCKKNKCIPDAFFASLTLNPVTTPVMLPFSLHCEPEYFLEFADNHGVLGRIPVVVQNQLLSMIDKNYNNKGITAKSLPRFVLTLKHLCRLKVRSVFRKRGVNTTKEFLGVIDNLGLPLIIKNYLRYL